MICLLKVLISNDKLAYSSMSKLSDVKFGICMSSCDDIKEKSLKNSFCMHLESFTS